MTHSRQKTERVSLKEVYPQNRSRATTPSFHQSKSSFSESGTSHKEVNYPLNNEPQVSDALRKENSRLRAALKQSVSGNRILCKALSEARHDAEATDRYIESLLNSLSHEIRTPMNAIVGFTELLLQPETTPGEHSEYQLLIQANSQRLLALIGDVIDSADIETSRIQMDDTELDVNQLMEELYELYLMPASEKMLNLTFTGAYPDEPILLNFGGVRIRQIMGKLLDNAILYTRKGGVEFGYRISNGFIRFFVHDSGIGISETEQARIFRPFSTGIPDPQRVHQGAGLGLYISNGLVRRLGGSLTVQSVQGRGSTFSIFFPYPEAIQKTP